MGAVVFPVVLCLTAQFCVLSADTPASVPTQCTVQVKLELGHRAQLRKKPTTEGFTHDWMVFVRGPEQCDIQHFVERVVFRLHESFPKPKRGQRGWACFISMKQHFASRGCVELSLFCEISP